MSLLRILSGNDFVNKTLNFQPGTIYLDSASGEMWFDDPTALLTEHKKIIDSETLIYKIEETIDTDAFNDSSNNSAVLGIGILGSMMLGHK